MPLFQYFGWVGNFLLVALFAADWCFPAPIAPPSDVPLDHKVHIRIHTDHKWPEPVVLDTTRATPAQDGIADGETDAGESGAPVLTESQPSDLFAGKRAPPPVGTSFQNRRHVDDGARKGLTFPNPPHKPPGKS
jgi:hypothetical protein